MSHEQWEYKIKAKYAKEYSNSDLKNFGLYTGKTSKKLEDDEFEAEYLTFHKKEYLENELKRQRKYSRPSYLKKLVEWAKTPEGQRYYRRKLGRE